MNFKELKLKSIYRSYFDDIINDFINPVFKYSEIYYRGTGYFTIKGLSEILRNLIPIIRKRGEVHIIISPSLTNNDFNLLNSNFDLDIQKTIDLIELEFNQEIENKEIILRLLTKLIQEEVIEIKVAFSKNGMFHEKIGLLIDNDNNVIEFLGSLNETENAYKNNLESIMVMKSWESEDVFSDLKYFRSLWNNHFEEISVIDFPTALKDKLIRTYDSEKNIDACIKDFEEISKKHRNLFDYQEKAIEEFMRFNGQHFFEMATGTGKTFTTVRALKKILERNKIYTIIVVPQIDLQRQWQKELTKENINNIVFFGGVSSDDFNTAFNRTKLSFISDDKSIVCISTYDTYFSKLYNKLDAFENTFLIIDEAHNISANQIAKLSNKVIFRLGLSATPEKHDKKLTRKILDYFLTSGQESFKFTIEEAINRGFLSKYNYYPIFVEIDDNEYSDFRNKSQRIQVLLSMDDIDYDAISRISNERNLILKKAKNKLVKFSEMLSENNYEFKNSVVYCGQGKVEDSENKLIDKVVSLLNNFEYDVSTFTSETENRVEVLDNFENGYFDTLVAIKCFDEGVDVPKLDKIYIMSSDKNHRQTIQRRGRVLRKCIESGKTLAHIYDFIVIPKFEYIGESASTKILEIELSRVREYIRLSENKNDYLSNIEELENKFYVKYMEEKDDEE